MFVNHNEVGVNAHSLGPHGKQIGLLTPDDAIKMLQDAGTATQFDTATQFVFNKFVLNCSLTLRNFTRCSAVSQDVHFSQLVAALSGGRQKMDEEKNGQLVTLPA